MSHFSPKSWAREPFVFSFLSGGNVGAALIHISSSEIKLLTYIVLEILGEYLICWDMHSSAYYSELQSELLLAVHIDYSLCSIGFVVLD